MFNWIMNYHDQVVLLLRIVLGIIFVYHGQAKVRKAGAMAEGFGWPKNLITLLGLAEIASGLGVAFGILLSWAALGMIVIMLGAMYYKIFKWKTPFWSMSSTGWEFDLLILVAALLILAHGPMEFSLMQ